VSILKTPNHLYSNSFMAFLKDPSLVNYSSSYTPLLSVLSSNSAAKHHLYHDDTQLLLSFLVLDFSHDITHLESTVSARNLGVIFNMNLSFAQQISAVSKSCFHNIRDLRHIRNTIDQNTATSLIHSKFEYCNSLLSNLPATQTNRLQLSLNSASRAVRKLLNFITLLLF